MQELAIPLNTFLTVLGFESFTGSKGNLAVMLIFRFCTWESCMHDGHFSDHGGIGNAHHGGSWCFKDLFAAWPGIFFIIWHTRRSGHTLFIEIPLCVTKNSELLLGLRCPSHLQSAGLRCYCK
jgi:hypothetical protein